LSLTQHLQLHPNPREIGKDDSTTLLMDLFEEKFLANRMKSLTQHQWQENLLRIEGGISTKPLRAIGLKFSSKYIKCR
jgi:hypothetical protein